MKNFSLIFSLVFFSSNIMADSFLETDFNQKNVNVLQAADNPLISSDGFPAESKDTKLELGATQEDMKIQKLLSDLKSQHLENKNAYVEMNREVLSSEKNGSFLEFDFGNNHMEEIIDLQDDGILPSNTKNNIEQANTVEDFSAPFSQLQENNTTNGWTCWDNAGSIYGIDPWLLMAYAKVESSFRENAINKNTNKSTDIGMMQINSIHLPQLARHGISKNQLYDACTSIHVGAWIAAENIKRFGYNVDGIGAYNSPGNIKIRRAYGAKVIEAYNILIKKYANY